MAKRITLPLGALLILACALPALAADPTPAQVYQAARNGNLAQAQQMIAQVLRDHPQSGEAHYVAAEIDARAGNLGLARRELRTAKSLEPGLPFVDRHSVGELEQQLGEAPLAILAQQTVRASRSPRFGLLLILIGAAVVLWMLLRRRAAAMGYPQYLGQYPPSSVPPGVPPGGYGPGGYPGAGYPGGYMPGGGPGIMGGVASGLALGAGVAAGEELVQHVAGGSNPTGGGFVPPTEPGPAPDPNADMGGDDFGVNDPGSWNDGGGGDNEWDDGSGGGWT